MSSASSFEMSETESTWQQNSCERGVKMRKMVQNACEMHVKTWFLNVFKWRIRVRRSKDTSGWHLLRCDSGRGYWS